MRCLALAEMLKTYFAIIFVCKEIPVNSVDELKAFGFGFMPIKEENEFLDLLKGNEIIVLDNYDLDSAYQQAIKGKGCQLVCIDDLHDKTFFADLIINHAPDVQAQDYSAQEYTQFALGLNYVLLRPEFLNKVNAVHHRDKIEDVFVCFGGADARNITQTVVNILKDDKRFKKIIVVTGPSYQYQEALQQSVAHNPNVILHQAIDAAKMSRLMLDAQLAIVPASGVLQEVMSMKLKVISGLYVDNQQLIFENYKKLNAFESAGNFEPESILKAIEQSFLNAGKPQQTFIDGLSGKRLLKHFMALSK